MGTSSRRKMEDMKVNPTSCSIHCKMSECNDYQSALTFFTVHLSVHHEELTFDGFVYRG